LKESELFTDRLNLASMAQPYIGKYFSQDYVRRKILRQTDEEIIEQDDIIAKEIEKGIIPDPSIPVDPQTGLPLQDLPPQEGQPAASEADNIKGELGKVPITPDLKQPSDKEGEI
jgi:hypothetical protein